MKTAFTNGNIFWENQIIANHQLIVVDGLIKEIISNQNHISPVDEIVDCSGLLIAPGFIDLQVNGCGGVMFNDNQSTDTLHHMRLTNLKSGTTTFLPTLVTCEDEKINLALEEVQHYHESFDDISIPGIHLEGPYISEGKSGIHNKKYIRKIDDSNVENLSSRACSLRMMTLCPNQIRQDQIHKLTQAGIYLSVGHSDADFNEALPKLKQGFSNATHLYNAMTTIPNGRNPGILCAAMVANLYAGIIADLNHVHPALIEVAYRLFGSRLYLVTDALASAGTDPESFKQFKFCGKEVYVQPNGFCADENGTLAGSSLTMDEGIRKLIKECHMDKTTAIKMATAIPAQAVGLKKVGLLTPGNIANLVLLDENCYVQNTYYRGKLCYTR